ncbi:MAG: DUF4384 domain-containing protein [Gemmatimonadales bacterium]
MMLALLLSLATVQSDSPPPITVKLNHEQFSRGRKARVYVQPAQDGYLVVLHADGDGRVRVLFPLDPTDDAFVRGGRREELRGRAGRDAFTVDVADGAGMVLAAISSDPFTYHGFVLNDHWDYRALGRGTVSDDPLAGLLDIVRRMSGEKSFEYDAATYVVTREIAEYGYPRYRIGLSFGYPYRFGYDPFYDPFCYDPFWGCYGYGYRYRFGYGFGYSFYPRRPYTYGFGRPFFTGGFGNRDGTRFVIPNRPARDRFTPVQPRPRSGDIAPRSRSFGGDRTIAPRDRGGRGSSGGRPSVGPRSSGGSRPAARASGGGRRSGGGGGRRN